MRIAIVLLALALPIVLAPAAEATILVPPVCHERSVTVLTVSAHVWITCGPGAEVRYCPPVGTGPCYALLV